MYANWSALLVTLVPLAVVTVTSTVPLPAGLVAVTWVALTTVNVVAALPPKLTPVAPLKSVPVMVTEVPPAAGPLPGATALTVGAGAANTGAATESEDRIEKTNAKASDRRVSPPTDLRSKPLSLPPTSIQPNLAGPSPVPPGHFGLFRVIHRPPGGAIELSFPLSNRVAPWYSMGASMSR